MKNEITTFRAEFRDSFRELNLEWIQRYFKVEKKDLEQVNDPERCVRDGGQIFFVVEEGRAVGTCALYKISEGHYELAKMAVSPACQGHGYGDLLMIAAEDWAKRQGARELLILSNTVLVPAIRLYRKHGFETVH